MITLAQPRAGFRRTLFSGLAATLVLGSLAFPSVRAAADQILQTFRAQQVTFVGVDANRFNSLTSLDISPTSLFLTQPTFTPGTFEERDVATYEEAASVVGFTPERVNTLPAEPTSEEISVLGGGEVSFTVDIDKVRNTLASLGINDVSLPTQLGAQPITAKIEPATYTKYTRVDKRYFVTPTDYTLYLAQGRSPEVTLPEGVELAQLGKAGLRVLGMNEIEADALSKQIDWRTTLVVPFPVGVSSFKQVQVGDVLGMLVQPAPGSALEMNVGAKAIPPGYTLLYWQRGDHFYVMAASGPAATENVLLEAAKSVR